MTTTTYRKLFTSNEQPQPCFVEVKPINIGATHELDNPNGVNATHAGREAEEAQSRRDKTREKRHSENFRQLLKRSKPWTPVEGLIVDWNRHQDPTSMDSRKMAITLQGIFRINRLIHPLAAMVQKIDGKTFRLSGKEYRAATQDLRPSVIILTDYELPALV